MIIKLARAQGLKCGPAEREGYALEGKEGPGEIT